MAESADFLINRRPAAGILLRVSGIFVADGAKNGQQGEDLLEVEPLVSRVLFLALRVVFCVLVTVSWYRFIIKNRFEK